MVSITGYTIQEKLHSGSYTETYRCLREKDKKTFILKLPRSEYPTQNEIASLHHEYHLLKTLKVPGVIQVEELIEQTHYPILVLEDIAGKALSHFLAEQPLDLKVFFKLTLQLVDTLGALHHKNIIHKDIKPANIIFESSQLLVKLTDLSIASQLTEENLNYMSLNKLEGTLAYMSPEQTGRMNRPLDYRTDFYSLGITFFEMLTGQLPFYSNDPLEMVHCHIAKTPLLVTDLKPQVPVMVANIIAKLLAKMPEERYASAIGLKKDLAVCAKEWEEHGTIPMFELGRQDLHDHLQISHRLYGREEQVKQLLTAFERVNQHGRCELLLVSGYSGIGKTAVVREVYKPIVRQRGYFISGKYDQLRHDTPYTAIIAAFQNLVKQVLADSEANLAKIKHAILEAVGGIGQVIIDLIPEVELIIGKQPPIPILNPIEAHNRFNLVFQNFIRVFSQAEHPLVIFLDDLQWADNASLNFIENLFADVNTHYLLLIGAYRDNEVPVGHSLLTTIQHLKKLEVPTEAIVLQPLKMNDIQQLLAETFCCHKAKVTALAVLLEEKTLGNPFFICEFLKTLYQEQQIRFSYEHGEWRWDMAQLERAGMTHNVVDLLATQIHKFPENTQRILKLAACIGHTFSLQILTVISEQTVLQVAQELWKAMQARFIVALEDSNKTAMLAEADRFITNLTQTEILYYQFSHDRIQHAAYSLIPEAARQQTHLQIGRLLLKEHPLQENSNQLFNTVNHFNNSISLLTDAAEKKQLAQYNFWAGQKAKASAAYSAALSYFNATKSLLPTDAWQTEYTFTFLLYSGLAECSYLAGQFEAAENYFDLLFQHVQNDFDRVKTYEVKVIWYNTLTRYKEVIKLGLAGLRSLGVFLPMNAKIYHVLYTIIIISWKIRASKIKNYKPFLMTDRRRKYACRLLSSIGNAAYLSNPNLMALVGYKLITLGLRYGSVPEVAFGAMGFAIIFICELNLVNQGFVMVELARKWMQQSPDQASNVKANMAYGVLVHHWKYPAVTGLDSLLQQHHIAQEAGFFGYAGYDIFTYAATIYIIGRPLHEALQAVQTTLAFLTKARVKEGDPASRYLQLNIQALQGDVPLTDARLNPTENIIEQFESNAEKCQLYMAHTKFSYIMGDVERALSIAMSGERWNVLTKGQFVNAENKVFYALALAACYSQATPTLQKSYRKKLKKFHKQLRCWTSWCPANFEHHYLLISAEIAAIQDTHQEKAAAINLYDQAIASAQRNDCLSFVAIANERAANFYLQLDKPVLAEYYILEAHHAYQRWGAFAKCKLLEQKYHYLFQAILQKKVDITSHTETTTSLSSMETFDRLAAFKSTLAISSEIQLDKLLQKLLRIMLEDAGAERCTLLCKQNDSWVIEADGNAEKQEIYMKPQLMTSASALPITLISYVQRTVEPIVIQDAVHAEQAHADPYVIQAKPKSILILPIVYQGQLCRIIYLENNLTTGAFTNQHLQMLKMLGIQAAISLENARLYYQATHDPLTELANRNLLYQAFSDYICLSGKEKNKKIAILFLDLDRFKSINDTLGHEVGDKLLIHVANQLKACIKAEDLAVRLGGDEFVLMVTQIKNMSEIRTLVSHLDALLTQPVVIQGNQLSISTSVGISLYPEEGTDIQALLRLADIALYRDKEIHHQRN